MREKTRKLYRDAASLVRRVKENKIDPRGVIRTKLRALRSYVSSSRNYRLHKERIDRVKQMKQTQQKEEEGKGEGKGKGAGKGEELCSRQRLRRQIIGDRHTIGV